MKTKVEKSQTKQGSVPDNDPFKINFLLELYKIHLVENQHLLKDLKSFRESEFYPITFLKEKAVPLKAWLVLLG